MAEAQAVLVLHVDRSADQGSGGLIVCADIHDGQILNHRGTMDTEFSDEQFFRPLCSEQALFSDLCVHRVSVVNLLGLLAQKKVRAFRPAPWKIQV